MTQTNLVIVIGTRPEATKLSPLLWALHGRSDCTIRVFFTGQQTDLVQHVIDDLGMKDIFRTEMATISSGPPDSRWSAHARDELRRILTERANSAVFVLGDTASALLGTEVAAQAGIPVCHIEAGLRLTRANIPEETNRREIAKLASIHCAPSKYEERNLMLEGIDRKAIIIIGDLSALYQQFAYRHLSDTIRTAKSIGNALSIIGETDIISGIEDDNYILCTFHRLASLECWPQLAIWLQRISRNVEPRRLILCSRPDTRWQPFYEEISAANSAVIIPAARPLVFQLLLRFAGCVITDSAGVQQEGLLSGKRVIAMREEVELYKYHPFLYLVPPPFIFNFAYVLEPLTEISHWVEPNPDWEGQAKAIADKIMRAIDTNTKEGLR